MEYEKRGYVSSLAGVMTPDGSEKYMVPLKNVSFDDPISLKLYGTWPSIK